MHLKRQSKVLPDYLGFLLNAQPVIKSAPCKVDGKTDKNEEMMAIFGQWKQSKAISVQRKTNAPIVLSLTGRSVIMDGFGWRLPPLYGSLYLLSPNGLKRSE